jgi:glutamate-1-semialdehyde 2,1-aminomutase
MTSPMKSEREAELREIARRVLPAGGFGNVSAEVVIREGKAGRVWDVSGNEYVDFLLGSGPMFLGHCHPDVTAAVQAQLARGSTFFANNEQGILLAEAIVDAVACAEQVRFCSSGTEADAYAMRLARAFRGREKILKFEGGYHGMSDWALMSLAPRRMANFPVPVPDSPGIPRALQNEVLVAPFNDADLAVAMIREHADELGGVIVEPFQRLIPPVPGFLKALRDVTAELGIPLIFDEVVTGFRFAYGGAQEYYGVVPDLCTLGKIVGGGFPLSAIAGRSDIMAQFDRAKVGDARFMTQVGTLSGNPVAAAAGLASLEVLRRPGTYESVFATGQALMGGMEAMLQAAGIPGQVIGIPVMFDVVFAEGEIRDYRGVLRGDAARLRRFNQTMREHGVLKGDSKFYVSTAHTEADVKHTLAAFAAAVEAEKKLMQVAA